MSSVCGVAERVVDLCLEAEADLLDNARDKAARKVALDDAKSMVVEEVNLYDGYLEQIKEDIESDPYRGMNVKHSFSVFSLSIRDLFSGIFVSEPVLGNILCLVFRNMEGLLQRIAISELTRDMAFVVLAQMTVYVDDLKLRISMFDP